MSNHKVKKKKGQIWAMKGGCGELYTLLKKRCVCKPVVLWHVLRNEKIEIWAESEMDDDSFVSGAQ